MIGNLLAVLQPQEIAQRHRIRTPPGNAALAGDPLEIANHVHAEVTPRGQRRRAHLRRVIRLARRLDKEIKTARDQHFLKPIVKPMPRPARHFPPGHDQIALPIALTPHRHPHKPRSVPLLHTESTKSDFVNGLLGTRGSCRNLLPIANRRLQQIRKLSHLEYWPFPASPSLYSDSNRAPTKVTTDREF